MDNNFLITYSYENNEGMTDFGYSWYESEESMIEDVDFKRGFLKDFEIQDAMEILGVRNIDLK